MSIKPTISKGIGALTPEVWGRLVDTIAWVEANKGVVNNMVAATSRVKTNITTTDQGFILAKIGTVTELNGAGAACFQWKYGFTKVGFVGGANACSTSTANVTATADTETTWAINLCEAGNTATLRSGYAHASNVIVGSDGFSIGQVPTNTIVQLFSSRHTTTTSRLQWFFYYQNPVVGGCPE